MYIILELKMITLVISSSYIEIRLLNIRSVIYIHILKYIQKKNEDLNSYN